MSNVQTAGPPSPDEAAVSKTTTAIHPTRVGPQDSAKTAASKTKETVKSSPLAGSTAGNGDDLNNTAAVSSSSDNNNRSQPTSLKGTFKGAGFLSLLLCCTFGAGSFLDNSDRSSHHQHTYRKKNTATATINNDNNNNNSLADTNTSNTERQTSLQIAEKSTNTPPPSAATARAVALPMIVTNPTDLALIQPCPPTPNQQQQQEEDSAVTSATPRSPPPQFPEGSAMWFLPPLAAEHTGRKCLVLDLDETLVHSSFKVIPNPDFIVPVEIDHQFHNVYVLKRPGVDEFMRKMGEIYEIVVFTASLSKYADPVLDILDVHRVVKHRLFRESCYNHKGTFVKDLSQLGRELSQTLILDNSPASYIFHTANAVPVSTWFNDPHDTELTDLVAFLEDLRSVQDVTLILDNTVDPST